MQAAGVGGRSGTAPLIDHEHILAFIGQKARDAGADNTAADDNRAD
jgi:hypothetical protein